MITARHHIVLYPMFQCLSWFLTRRNFHSVNMDGSFVDNGNAVLVIANHMSWWDGFWVEYLNRKLLHRKFHFMMLEEQLRKHWYFQYVGGYSVKKKSRGIIDSVNYTLALLKHPGNLVLMFPEGKIHSLYQNKVTFEKGIERIIHNTSPETQVIFVANLIDYLSDGKPNLFIYLKTFLAKDFRHSNAESEYNNFYEQVRNIQKAKIS